jgi:outer membrane protein OmpA-like peptidoglycan-associated protein
MRVLLISILIFPLTCLGQNLLLNGSFEEENICSEYEVNCAPEAWIYTMPSFNYYFKDEERAHSGSHFVALIAANSKKSFHRSYVRSRLLCGLRKGKTYRLDLYVKSLYPALLDSVGVYFSNYDFLFEKQPFQSIRPAVYFVNGKQKPNRRDTNWQHIVIDYVGRGDESFLTLGIFKKADVQIQSGARTENNLFIFFDDVSLLPTDGSEALCKDWRQRMQQIYDENERHEYQMRAMKFYKAAPKVTVEASPTRILKIDTFTMPDILFKTNSFQLDKVAMLLLDSIGRKFPDTILDSIVVEGHTDNIGKPEWNEQLAVNRANSVAAYLEYFMNTKVIARGWGARKPIADNNKPGGRRKNRRVEVYLYRKD